MAYQIERPKQGDEAILAYIQTESWKSAFRDILAPEVLTQYTNADKATAMYKHILDGNVGNGYLLTVDGQPHCIAWWGATREKDMPGYAELICIHSLPNRWRSGYGSEMMNVVLKDVAAAGYERMMLWVFEENTSARRFYEKYGFKTNGKVKSDFGPPEVCYEKAL